MFSHLIADRIATMKNVLIAGAGGGYDVVCGVPIATHLHSLGVNVHMASFSSTPLNDVAEAVCHSGTLLEVTPQSYRPSYFPEGWLSRWLAQTGANSSVWCFTASGVGPLHESYQYLIERLSLDTIILVDGGVDSLLRGDEHALASALEDAVSMAAVNLLDGPEKLLVATVFGAERLDGISHAQVLARVAELSREQAFLAAEALIPGTAEADAFMDCAGHILSNQQGMHQSVVCASLAAAIQGRFGDTQVNPYTANTPPWISPLMLLYWWFDLDTVARQNLYLSRLIPTRTYDDAVIRLGDYMRTRPKRGWEGIPI